MRRILTVLFLVLGGCVQQTPQTKVPPKPNILLIVADDLGFSDIAPFGGNINTPVLSALAKQSTLFSNFHVLPTCSPTRSALLTGNDNHVAGIGIMSETNYPALRRQNLPGYRGALSKQVVTIPELLRANNYHTYMVGKWHLGDDEGEDPFDRGFEETFTLGTGGGSHFANRKALAPPQHMEYSRNGKVVEPPADFYSSKNYTDSLLAFIDRNKTDQKPFFAFLSYTAVHDPLHAPLDYIQKYKGKFDMGWDSLWTERFQNLKKLGVVPENTNATRGTAIPEWNKLDSHQKADFARDMEVYAAMLDYMDMSIGRVFDYLKQNNLYDNTMIIFMSDNGANGAMATSYPGNEDGVYLASFDNSLENRGLEGSYIETGPGWAQASSSPFRYFKGFTTEGGIRAPLIVKMPMQTQGDSWNNSLTHVADLMPTILEITDTSYPEVYNGNPIHKLIGKSMVPLLNGASTEIHAENGIGYELFEMKAYIKGQWKILRLPVPMGTGDWQLYDIRTDPAETVDLSAKHPEIRSELIEAWNRYAAENELYDHKGHYDSMYRRNFK